jgi:hypothetical protein
LTNPSALGGAATGDAARAASALFSLLGRPVRERAITIIFLVDHFGGPARRTAPGRCPLRYRVTKAGASTGWGQDHPRGHEGNGRDRRKETQKAIPPPEHLRRGKDIRAGKGVISQAWFHGRPADFGFTATAAAGEPPSHRCAMPRELPAREPRSRCRNAFEYPTEHRGE